jgi:hypothetical protein
LVHSRKKAERLAFIADIESISRGAGIANAEAASGVVQKVQEVAAKATPRSSGQPKGPGVSTRDAARAIGMFVHLGGLPMGEEATDEKAGELADRVMKDAVKHSLPIEKPDGLVKRTVITLLKASWEGILWADRSDSD